MREVRTARTSRRNAAEHERATSKGARICWWRSSKRKLLLQSRLAPTRAYARGAGNYQTTQTTVGRQTKTIRERAMAPTTGARAFYRQVCLV